MTTHRALILAATALVGLMLAPLRARAQSAPPSPETPPPSPTSLPVRSATIGIETTVVQMGVNFRDVVDADISKKLLSGLPTVLSLRAYVFRETGGDPIALAARTCRIVYDLWDEVFRIQLTQAGGQLNTVAVNVEGVLRNCAEARKLPLIDRGLLRDGARYFVAALVEVNPVSAEILDRIKRWVTRPAGDTAIGPGDALFGSFVGLFVTRIDSADRRLTFRTQAFLPPDPPPPPPPPPQPPRK
ncbi:hypothetical protein [Chondromyces apiculatus]|uniref:Uncharacterized protein n=1 Tax=Chondromyces apiculatus DSM 436 TaxID=1192034 RepID=A0A017SWI0_9BACT|nr:hypothetical protein [Chondromyces apiculatus]EYF01329.1 Hypothetical protein CAP_8371 [Chondromyces apiculatus DSM 436]